MTHGVEVTRFAQQTQRRGAVAPSMKRGARRHLVGEHLQERPAERKAKSTSTRAGPKQRLHGVEPQGEGALAELGQLVGVAASQEGGVRQRAHNMRSDLKEAYDVREALEPAPGLGDDKGVPRPPRPPAPSNGVVQATTGLADR